jgi:hypothetical protein
MRQAHLFIYTCGLLLLIQCGNTPSNKSSAQQNTRFAGEETEIIMPSENEFKQGITSAIEYMMANNLNACIRPSSGNLDYYYHSNESEFSYAQLLGLSDIHDITDCVIPDSELINEDDLSETAEHDGEHDFLIVPPTAFIIQNKRFYLAGFPYILALENQSVVTAARVDGNATIFSQLYNTITTQGTSLSTSMQGQVNTYTVQFHITYETPSDEDIRLDGLDQIIGIWANIE